MRQWGLYCQQNPTAPSWTTLNRISMKQTLSRWHSLENKHEQKLIKYVQTDVKYPTSQSETLNVEINHKPDCDNNTMGDTGGPTQVKTTNTATEDIKQI